MCVAGMVWYEKGRTSMVIRMTKLSVIAALLLLSGCFAAPVYDGPPVPNHDGNQFRNKERLERGPADVLRLSWQSLFNMQAWPQERLNSPVAPPPARVVGEEVRVTYINHATTLIQVDGVNILTDPVYSERVSPVSWAGPKRVRSPGFPMDDLPQIDVILISHNHYDHLDATALKKLYARQKEPPVLLAGLGNAGLFEDLGLSNFKDLNWDEYLSYKSIGIHFVACRHRSGRGIADQSKTLWGSFVIETRLGNIYFAGDTGFSPHFQRQGERFGPFLLSILPIGAYDPRWFMKEIHLNPAEAVEAHQALRSEQSLGIHFGVFQLTFEGIDEPVTDLDQALEQADLPRSSFWTLEPGEWRVISPLNSAVSGGAPSPAGR